MERMRSFKTPGLVGLVVLLLTPVIILTTCKNPVSLFEEVKIEVMKANDRVLRIDSVSIPLQADGTFSPTGTIEIRFDKEIELPGYSEMWKYVKISKVSTSGTEAPIQYPAEGVSYFPTTKVLKIRVYPYLATNTDFVLQIVDIVSSTGSYSILEGIDSRFRTSNILTGAVTSLVSADEDSLPGYSRGTRVDLAMSVNQPYAGMDIRYQIYLSGGSVVLYDSDWFPRPLSGTFSLENLDVGPGTPFNQSGGQVSLEVRFSGRSVSVAENAGTIESASIIIDTEAPQAGTIQANSNSSYALMSFVTLGFGTEPTDTGSGVAVMSFSNDGSVWSDWEPYEPVKSWDLVAGFGGTASDGTKTVHARVRDRAGHISSTSTGIILDTTPPSAPIVSGTALTNQTSHTWTWVQGGGDGNDQYRYQLNGMVENNWTSPGAASTEYAASGLESNRSHVLYVQERDAAGNWSSSGSFTVAVDSIAPQAPSVSALHLTNDTTPEWSWTGNNSEGSLYRYQLNSTAGAWTETGAGSCIPATALAGNTTHTLYVQQRDMAGNWSSPGSWAVFIDTDPPAIPVVSGPTNTRRLRPTWTWSSGNGNGMFRYALDGETDWTETTTTSFTPIATFSDGESHTLYVRERDAAGNWSASGYKVITVDLSALPSPEVSIAASVTTVRRPSWTWETGDDEDAGDDWYQYELVYGMITIESGEGAIMSYTPGIDLGNSTDANGVTYTLKVRQRFANKWSSSGSQSITVDIVPPLKPVITGFTPTNDLTPAWSWASGGNGNGIFLYQLDGTSGAWTESTALTYSPASSIAANTAHTLYVRERDVVGNWSEAGTGVISIDTIPPNAPVVGGPVLVNTRRPSWTWASGGNGGAGVWRYQLNATGDASWNDTNMAGFTPASDLAANQNHTLYVQERDAAGNWSASGSLLVHIDTLAPSAPVVSGPSLTNVLRPTWNWVSGGGYGNGTYRYQFNGTNGIWTETAAASLTPNSDLAANTIHTLYVQERDAAGNWSVAGSFSTILDTSGPAIPIVTGNTPTNNLQPTWNWSSGGGGNGNFRYKFNSLAVEWTSTQSGSYTPTVNLVANNGYVLYVQEQDATGNWSESGTWTIVVDTIAPNPPNVSASTPTNNLRPTWNWSSGGNEGGGFYQFQLNGTTGAWAEETGTVHTPSVDLEANTSHILYVRERDMAGNWSVPGSFAVLVDTIAPAAPSVPDLVGEDDTGNSASDNVTRNTSNLSMSGTVEPLAMIQVKTGTTILGTGTANSNGGWSIDIQTMNAGTYTIHAVATDIAGNTSADSAGMTLIVDTTIPAAPSAPDLSPSDDSGISNVDNITNTMTGLTFTGTVEAYAIVQLLNGATVLGSVPAGADGTWSIDATLSSGNCSITAVATDLAGNIGAASTTTGILVDTSAPAVTSITNTFNGAVASYLNTGTFTFTATAGDSAAGTQSGVASVNFYKDTSGSGLTNLVATDTSASYTWAWTTASDSNDWYYIKAVAVDIAGNSSVLSSISRYVDRTAPTGGTWVLNAGATYTNSSTVTATASAAPYDSDTGVVYIRFSSDASAWSNWQSYVSSKSWNIADTAYGGNTTQGTRYVYVQAFDNAGNVSTSVYDAIVFDNSAPNAGAWTINNAAAYTNNALVTVSKTADPTDSYSGIAQIQFSNNASTWSALEPYVSSRSWDITSSSYGGTTTNETKNVFIRVVDGAGNYSGYTYDGIIYDTVAPGYPAVSGTTPTTSRQSTWSWSTGSGDVNSFQYYLFGLPSFAPFLTAGWSGVTSATSYTPPYPLLGGTYSLAVVCYDATGNQSGATQRSIVISAPPNPPVVTGTSPTLDSTPSWFWSSGGYGIGIYRSNLDGAGYSADTTSTSYAPASSLSEGMHTLEVQEKDYGGSWSSSGSATVRVTSVLPFNGQVSVSKTPLLQWRAGMVGYTYQVQLYAASTWMDYGPAVTSTSYQVTSPFSLFTSYTWRVKARKLTTTVYLPSAAGAVFTTGGK